MDGPRDYHTKWSQTEKDNYHIVSLTCRIKKTMQMNLQNRKILTDTRKLVTKGDKWGVKTQLLYMWKNNKDLLCSSGNCTQYLIITYNGAVSEKEHIYIHTHTYESPLLLFSRQVMSNCLWPLGCSMPGLPVLHHLLEFAQVHVHWTSDESLCCTPKTVTILQILYLNLKKHTIST